jgi:hypothetical protein
MIKYSFRDLHIRQNDNIFTLVYIFILQIIYKMYIVIFLYYKLMTLFYVIKIGCKFQLAELNWN